METSGCTVEVGPRTVDASFYTIGANPTALGASNHASEVRPRVVKAGTCIMTMLSRSVRASSGDLESRDSRETERERGSERERERKLREERERKKERERVRE